MLVLCYNLTNKNPIQAHNAEYLSNFLSFSSLSIKLSPMKSQIKHLKCVLGVCVPACVCRWEKAIYSQYLELLSFPSRLNVKRQPAAYLQADYMKMSSAFCFIAPLQMTTRHVS